MKWEQNCALSNMTRRSDGRGLLMYISAGPFGQWMIAAIESDISNVDPSLPVEHAIAAVFANHAHDVIKPEPTLPRAIATAERYVRWWRRSHATHAKCPCETIESAAQ